MSMYSAVGKEKKGSCKCDFPLVSGEARASCAKGRWPLFKKTHVSLELGLS